MCGDGLRIHSVTIPIHSVGVIRGGKGNQLLRPELQGRITNPIPKRLASVFVAG